MSPDRPPVSGEPSEWECGATDNKRPGYVCGRPTGHKGMHRRRTEARATPPSLDARIVERIFEGEIGNRLYFYGAAYGHDKDESWGKIADDFAAEYARLSSESRPASDSGEPPA